MRETRARKLGFWALLALVVGNLIGSGIYLLPATLAPFGWNQLIGWIVTIIGAGCLAQVFARLSRKIPEAGGVFVYTKAAFGPTAGFFTAWAYWLMTCIGNAAIAVAVVSALSLVFPAIGQTQGLPAVLAIGCVWLVTLVNLMGVRAAGLLQEVTVVLKLIPLVALIAIAIFLWVSGAPRAPDPGVAIGAGPIAATAALTFWGFIGLDTATIPADKVEAPERNIARATLWGVAVTGLVYFGISLAFALFMPVDEAAASPAPIAAFLGRYFGSGIAAIVALFAAISALGTLNGFVLVQAEMPWAMAQGGVFPAWFGKNTARGVPLRSHIVSSTLLSVVTLMNFQRSLGDLFTFIASVSLAAGLLTYFVTALAALRLVRSEPVTGLAALVSAGFTLWAEWGLGFEAVLYGALLVVAGLPVYWLVRNAGSSGSSAGQQG